MKAMGIDHVRDFPFPTNPDRKAITKSLSMLSNLGALNETTHKVTRFGRILANFPIAARFAKMLILAQKSNCLEYAIAIVSALSGQEPFIAATERRDAEAEENDKLDGE